MDSIEGQVGDEHAKVKYTCSENEILYGAHRLVENMKNVTQEGQDLVA